MNTLVFLREMRLETLYVIIAFSVGGFMVFVNPPFQVPDEPAHYYKALGVAQGRFQCVKTVTAPANYVALPADMVLVKIKGEERKKVSGNKMISALTTPASRDSVAVPSVICAASPLGHLTQALGLKLGLLTDAPPLMAFWLGRLLTLLIAGAAIYWAIRIAPFGKLIFLLIGLLPSVIQQIASVSYDALHIGLILLFTAAVLKLTHEAGELSSRQQWLILGLSLLALNVKPGYFLLSLLVFLLPKEKLPTVKRYWFFTIGFVMANFAFFLLLRTLFTEAASLAEGIDPSAQLREVLGNPLNFLYVVFHSLYKSFTFYYETFFLKPGWINSSLPDLLYVFMTLGIILLLRSRDELVSLTTRQRLIFLGVFFAQLILIFLSMYLVWTKVGDERVKGVQGRYFLAIAPLLILSFYKSKFRFKSEWIREHLPLAVLVFAAITFLFTFHKMLGLYYKDILSYF